MEKIHKNIRVFMLSCIKQACFHVFSFSAYFFPHDIIAEKGPLYIFFLPSFTGYPGGYERIGGLRLDECAAYGCLLELTIQLGIIMIGKQILNNVAELGVP